MTVSTLPTALVPKIETMVKVIEKLSNSELNRTGDLPVRNLMLSPLDMAITFVSSMLYKRDGTLHDSNKVLINGVPDLLKIKYFQDDADVQHMLDLLTPLKKGSVITIEFNNDIKHMLVEYTLDIIDNEYVFKNTSRIDLNIRHEAQKKLIKQGYITFKDMRLVASGLCDLTLKESNILFDYVIDNHFKSNKNYLFNN